MAKIINFILLMIITACATAKKDEDYGLTIKQRDILYKELDILESYKKENDQLFEKHVPTTCSQNWSKSIEELKKNLKVSKNEKERHDLWFQLGNCYALVGENRLAMYYYDLVLGLKLNNKKVDSSVYFNLGQIYENAQKNFLAYSFYKIALENDNANHMARFKLAILESQQAEYSESNKYLIELQRYYPKSNVIQFLIGVNYFHLGKKADFINKVLKKIDEKSHGRILLAMVIDYSENKNLKHMEADLKNLELNFKIYKDFKSYLLYQLER